MALRDQQRDALRHTIEWARKIEEYLGEARRSRLGEVHFRPASTGVSMVGLRPDRPQRGKTGVRGLERLAKDFESQFEKHCVACEHRRPTPEKQLQSWLVAQAYRSERLLESIRHQSDASAPVFVTDELVLQTKGGKRVCDLLALHEDRPAALELKSARQLKCLIEQVTTTAAYVDEHAELFSELYSVILGRPISLEQPCAKWIVWPAAGHGADPREAELAALGIRVVGYAEEAEGYGLTVGSPIHETVQKRR